MHLEDLTRNVVGLEMSRDHDQVHVTSPVQSAPLKTTSSYRHRSGHLDRDCLVEKQQTVHEGVF